MQYAAPNKFFRILTQTKKPPFEFPQRTVFHITSPQKNKARFFSGGALFDTKENSSNKCNFQTISFGMYHAHS